MNRLASSVLLSILASNVLAGELPAQSTITRIALGSCAFQWEDQAILNEVVDARPDIYLSLGDAIYADFDGNEMRNVTPESLQAEWGKLAALPTFRSLRDKVPLMATWDNHDYGCHDCGAEFPLRAESEQIFLDFWRVPDSAEVRQHPGVYQSAIFGPEGRRVQIILLDTRAFRDRQLYALRPQGAGGSLGKYRPNAHPNARLLGDAQWTWLKEQLGEPAEIRFIASSTQIVADQKGMDEWGNYPVERLRLVELIASTGAKGVILLSGNVHFAELSRLDFGPYPLYDFTSSGLTHVNDGYARAANKYRVGRPFVDLNFGLVDIDWQHEAGPQITFRIINRDGKEVMNQAISYRDLH